MSTEVKRKTRFKDFFFVKDETPTSPNEKTEPLTPSNTTKVVMANSAGPVGMHLNNSLPNNLNGIVDEKYLTPLCKVLDARNIPGPDVQEVLSASDAMASYLPDESSRLIAAFHSIKANAPQLTKKSTLDSIDYYIEEMENERKKGTKQMEIERKRTVLDREAEVEAKRKQILDASTLIQTLQNEINDAVGEIATAKNKCDIEEANFNATINFVVDKFKNTKIKIETLITE